MPETFVLLHGSWHGGWAWEPTAWCLRELGHTAYAPTYPGHRPGASRAGVREMGGSHEVMFTRPAELARKLAEASND